MDEKEIYSTGYHKGQKKEKIEIAKILKEKGMNKKEISEITKLTIAEIEEI